MVIEKKCPRCGQIRLIAAFSPRNMNRRGRTICDKCKQKRIEAYKPRQRVNSQRWRDNHRELKRAESLEYAREHANDPAVKARQAAYRSENRQRYRDLNNRRNAQLKVDVFNHYGGRCFCCGESDFRFLTIDHSNNDGAAWRKHFGGKISGGKLYKVIVELGYPDDLRLACWNCNCGRQWNRANPNTCPHEEERLRLVA